MRVANKNELFALMEDRALVFSGFCLTPEGKEINFLINNLTGFDFDLPIMQTMFAQLSSLGVLDSACLERFDAFKRDVVFTPDGQVEQTVYIYEVPIAYPLPLGVISIDYYADRPAVKVITVPTEIQGLTGVVRHGIF